MTRSYLTRSWSMAAVMLGATALSPPAVAQNANQVLAQNTNSANSAANQSRQRPVDPGVRAGAPGAGGPLPGLSQNELSFGLCQLLVQIRGFDLAQQLAGLDVRPDVSHPVF